MSNAESHSPSHRRNLLLRFGLTVIAIIFWFWTQSLIGARPLPSEGINDGLHNLLGPLNSYFNHAPSAANALLIISSALIDTLGVFLIARWLFGASIRPFLALILLLGIRQVIQVLCALPTPPYMIWRYPGFPSIFVTYNVANDYYFSGHSGIAVLGALELARFRRSWLTVLAVVVVAFEIAAVLILRAHYTMDVFTGIVTALWVATLCDMLSPRLDRFLSART